MQISRTGKLDDFSHLRAANARVFSLVINVQQFAGLPGIQKQSVAANKLQCVPLRGIVAGSDRNAAMGAMMTDKQLNGRHRTHSDINDATAARKQTRYYRLLYHFTGSTWIAPDND